MLKEMHPNIRIRIYISFLSRVIGSMVFPFMAIYFTKEINATAAGILLMIQIGIQFLASLYGGFLADTKGRKKMMVLGEWLKVVAFIGMILANSPWWTSPWLMFFMLLLMSISTGFINPAADAMMVDVSTKETRAFMYTINYWAANLSLMLGLMVGGWLFQTNFFELLIALLLISFITLWMTATLIHETYKIKQESQVPTFALKPIFQSYWSVIRDIPFILFTLGGIAIMSIEYQRNNYISIKLAEEFHTRIVSFFGMGQFSLDGVRLLSILTVENTLFIVLFSTVIARFVRKQQNAIKPIMYVGFLFFGLGYAMMAISNQLFTLFLSVIILSIGELLYVPTRQTILAEMIDESKRGTYMAFNGFIFQIGKIIGSACIIFGEVFHATGMGVLYMAFAGLGIVLCSMGTKRFAKKNLSIRLS
ncbi:MDR family MFS transporter [Bacillus massilinigeriensis]|uniref:MDR family MFS transporter n=1 Tax=Bacillus massilionigeriensis TaxID=1805475 RepID=UPI00096AE11A|nr:MFS transporter [Bacillus massilionigeriensis]